MVQEYKRYAIYVFLKIIQLFLNSFAQTTISSVIAVYAKTRALLPFEEVSVEANKEARAHIYFPMDPNNTFLLIRHRLSACESHELMMETTVSVVHPTGLPRPRLHGLECVEPSRKSFINR